MFEPETEMSYRARHASTWEDGGRERKVRDGKLRGGHYLLRHCAGQRSRAGPHLLVGARRDGRVLDVKVLLKRRQRAGRPVNGAQARAQAAAHAAAAAAAKAAATAAVAAAAAAVAAASATAVAAAAVAAAARRSVAAAAAAAWRRGRGMGAGGRWVRR